MSVLTQKFLADQRLLRENDLADLMGWNASTTKAKIARRDVPRFIRQNRVVLFAFDDVRVWLESDSSKHSDAASLAATDLLCHNKAK